MASNNQYLEETIWKMKNGEVEALSDLYVATKEAIYGFALSILKNIHEAEEVLQEVYIKIYQSADLYKPNDKPLAWILTITKNLAYMRIRQKKNYVDILELEHTLVSNNDDIENKLFIETIFQYISDEERNILTLHSLSGFKHREIAKMLDMPLATVLSKYNRAIKKIKKRMSEEDYEKERY